MLRHVVTLVGVLVCAVQGQLMTPLQTLMAYPGPGGAIMPPFWLLPQLSAPRQFGSTRPLPQQPVRSTHTAPKVRKSSLRDQEEEEGGSLTFGLPVANDPADEVLGTLPKMPEGLSPTEQIIWRIEYEREKKNNPKPLVQTGRDLIYQAINQVNVLNMLEPVVHPIGATAQSLISSKKDSAPPPPPPAPKPGEKPDGSVKPTTGIASYLAKIQDTLKTSPDMGVVRFNPQNFRSVYWLYPMLASMYAFRNPSPHTLGFLPWTFYFANLASKMITWDKDTIGKALS